MLENPRFEQIGLRILSFLQIKHASLRFFNITYWSTVMLYFGMFSTTLTLALELEF